MRGTKRLAAGGKACRQQLAMLLLVLCARAARSDDERVDTQEKLTLFQLDPVKALYRIMLINTEQPSADLHGAQEHPCLLTLQKGYVRDFEAEPGRVLQVETKALQPPLFEIPGFLTPDECDYIIDRALREGLYPSGVNDDAYYKALANGEDGQDAATDPDPELEEKNADLVFKDLDVNDDTVLDTEELLSVLNTDNAFLRPKDVLQMYGDLGLDPDSDGKLTLEEFISIVFNDRLTDIENWVWKQTGHGENRIRESKQAWLGQPGPATDPVLAAIQRRVVSLTRLPETIVQWSEQLQVVRYEPGGHFHAHYDSNELDSDMKCMMNGNSGRFCRFMTILYYLEDSVSGGETAFPVADNGTYSQKATRTEIYDLSNHCHDANLFIKPEKGKAIMWYNHYINETTGWMGDLNLFSLHGGCEVLAGTKWIANNWIWVDDSYERQMEFLRQAQQEEKYQTDEKVELSKSEQVANEPDFQNQQTSIQTPKTRSCSNGDEL